MLHAGGLHLAFNVLGLHLFGPAIESRLGSSVFLGLFFLSGLIGNLSGMWPLRDMIGVGASGGVMGILGATLILLRSEVWSGLEEVRKRYLRDLVILLFANLVIGHLEAQVFNAAHIGGPHCRSDNRLAFLPSKCRQDLVDSFASGNWSLGPLARILWTLGYGSGMAKS